MDNNLFRLAICSAIVFCCLACAAVRQPILAPNDHLQGKATSDVQRDIDECIRYATAGSGAARSKQIASQTAGGAAIGAAAGAVAGAISGGPGAGAVAGVAGGATGGLLHGLIGSRNLDAQQQRDVEDCLRQKGYDPIGWQ